MVTSFVLPDGLSVGVICGLYFFSDTPARVIAPADAAGTYRAGDAALAANQHCT
ncbi:TPA: hypothetical protein ACNVQT_004061 [Citrobacter farmeri]